MKLSLICERCKHPMSEHFETLACIPEPKDRSPEDGRDDDHFRRRAIYICPTALWNGGKAVEG